MPPWQYPSCTSFVYLSALFRMTEGNIIPGPQGHYQTEGLVPILRGSGHLASALSSALRPTCERLFPRGSHGERRSFLGMPSEPTAFSRQRISSNAKGTIKAQIGVSNIRKNIKIYTHILNYINIYIYILTKIDTAF